MDFEIKNVLQKSNLKKFAMPAAFIAVGIVVIVYFKNRGSNVSTSTMSSTGSGAIDETEDNNSDALSAMTQQFTNSLAATNNSIEEIRKQNQDSITALEKSVADVIIDERKLSQDQIKNLSTQLVSYQDSNSKALTNMFDSLIQKMNEKINNPVYNPTPSSYNPTPTVSTSPSSNPTPVQTSPSIPEGNPYNANPNTGEYNYGGVDYSAYDGSEKWNGTKEEAAYWNNFINS